MRPFRFFFLKSAILLVLLLFTASNSATAGKLYLNLIWHQHQPLYLDPETDQLRGPWVRTHATKDYYDMAAMIREFPEIHVTINLTSSLLLQLQDYYVARLEPYLFLHEDGWWAINADDFLRRWKGKTDPWIDLALTPSTSYDSLDRAKLLTEVWNAFGISDVQIGWFPEYATLREKARIQSLTTDELTQVKSWFYLAHFDPDFLRGISSLAVNLNDLVEERNGRFYLRRPFTERDANRLVAEAVRVMREVVPVHRELMYDPVTHEGQLELITTPFYHPILPLLIDSDVAHICQPEDPLPARFAYPSDARAQVIKGVDYYRRIFGRVPRGMWPAEGSISEAAADVFASAGIQWICGDMQVLAKSTPSALPVAAAYHLNTASGKELALVFRETHLSDHIGFTYQNMDPVRAAARFVQEVLKYRPTTDESACLLTVILDGENAWEWYSQDMDAKRFLRHLYTVLTYAHHDGYLTCVTPTEFFEGNPARNVPAHPIASLSRIDNLWPGSWIGANFSTWIGEPEENQAWEYLRQTRRDLEQSGLPQPDPRTPPPADARSLPIWKAYESLYAAEGSDWFWWYGADQTAGGGDLPFEQAFFSHLRAVYRHAYEAGARLTVPKLKPILSPAKVQLQSGGTMALGVKPTRVKFEVWANNVTVSDAIYIVGNIPELASWRPNVVRMYDDGTHGDEKAGDHYWTIEIPLMPGTEVQYKYTNSGKPGEWSTEEFPFRNRSLTVEELNGGIQKTSEKFGE